MVCDRCKMVVKLTLERFGLHPLLINLGEVEIEEELNKLELENLQMELKLVGFEILNDKKSRTIEKIKNAVVKIVHYPNEQIEINFSNFISEQLHQDYSYLSSLFSEVEGTTIEKYFITQKIERAKEQLLYDEYSISEIAFKLNYKSLAHLSSQFKKITGITPTEFKKLKTKTRNNIENL